MVRTSLSLRFFQDTDLTVRIDQSTYLNDNSRLKSSYNVPKEIEEKSYHAFLSVDKSYLSSIEIVYCAYRPTVDIPTTVGIILKEKPPKIKHITTVIGGFFDWCTLKVFIGMD